MKKVIALVLAVVMCLVMLAGCNEAKDVIAEVEPTTAETTTIENNNDEVPIRLIDVRYSLRRISLLGKDTGAMLISYKNVSEDKDIIDVHFKMIAKDERGNVIVNSETKDKEFLFFTENPVKSGGGDFFQISPTGFDLGETYDIYVSSVTFSDGTEWISNRSYPTVTVKRNYLSTGEVYEHDIDKSVYDFQDILISNLKSYGLQYESVDPASGIIEYNFYYNDLNVSYGFDSKTKIFNDIVKLEYQASPAPLEMEMAMLKGDELKEVQAKIEKYYYALLKTIIPNISDEEISEAINRNENDTLLDVDIKGYKVRIIETLKPKEQKAEITVSKEKE